MKSLQKHVFDTPEYQDFISSKQQQDDPKDLKDQNEDVSKISQDPIERRRSSRDAKNKKDPKDQIADLKNSGDQKVSVTPRRCTKVTEEKVSNPSISKPDVSLAKSKVDQIKPQKGDQNKAQKESSDSSGPELLECTLVLEIVESPSKSSKKVEKSTDLDSEKFVKTTLDGTIKKVLVTESETKTNSNTCETCKKEFAGPKTLKIHQRVHSKVKDDTTEESEKKPEIVERKRKSEIVLQQPEVVLSAGNDSSNSEKSEKKPKWQQKYKGNLHLQWRRYEF